ncbi:hypothetical protein BTVI_80655 [Pitangus sulphuratus]|nr:hypothetical protein BTVI_80655 [Pitangus sulphuratus]
MPAAPRCLTLQTPIAASANVRLSPLPAAASGSSLRGRVRAEGLVPSSHQELVPPAQRGSMAADRAWETPPLESRTAGLWERSVARQGHRLPPLAPARRSPLCTRAKDARKDLLITKTEELEHLEEEDDEKIYGDISRLEEESSIKTTCIPNQTSLRQEPVAGPQVCTILYNKQYQEQLSLIPSEDALLDITKLGIPCDYEDHFIRTLHFSLLKL